MFSWPNLSILILAILFQSKTLQTTSADKPSAQNVLGNNRVLTILWLDYFRQPSNIIMEMINECVLQTVNLKYLVVSIYINISWILNTFFVFSISRANLVWQCCLPSWLLPWHLLRQCYISLSLLHCVADKTLWTTAIWRNLLFCTLFQMVSG